MEKERISVSEAVAFYISKFGDNDVWINMVTGNGSIYTSMSKEATKQLIEALQKVVDELVEES